ncbi:MAG: TSUP family transporter [Lachnospiraceae bacterium]|nr:TSUP family transporter [Lachnospiraceae bacterium]
MNFLGINPLLLLILCPLIFLSGFVDSIAGGGGLISLPAYMIIGLPPHVARGTNKISSFLGTFTATVRYAKKGFIPYRQAIFCVVFALGGSFIGTKLGLLVDENVFKIIMLVIIPATAAYVWFHKQSFELKTPYSTVITTLLACAVAFVIGMYDGFYGPGTGTFLLLLLTSVAHLSIDKAQGISKSINVTTNATSLVIFIIEGKALIATGLIAGAFSMAGSILGTKMYFKDTTKVVRPVMIAVLVIFFVKVLLEVIGVEVF